MTHVVYSFEIPDPARPIPLTDRGVCGPSGELIRFIPAPLNPTDITNRKISQLSTHVGTYGMGGPGFFGLHLGTEWLVIALWGASDWILVDETPITDAFFADCGRTRPWITDDSDTISERVVGYQVASIMVRRHYLKISLTSGVEMLIEELPEKRPPFGGSKELRAFAETDDLQRGVFLAPTDELWV